MQNDLPKEEILLEWKAPLRVAVPKSREHNITLIAIVSVVALVLFLAEGIMPVILITALFFLYWLRSLTPVSVSQPILQVAEMLFPTLIGLWVFKEIKKVSLKEKLYYGLAVIGGLTIIFSF